jgi:hypothetical protein
MTPRNRRLLSLYNKYVSRRNTKGIRSEFYVTWCEQQIISLITRISKHEPELQRLSARLTEWEEKPEFKEAAGDWLALLIIVAATRDSLDDVISDLHNDLELNEPEP